MADLKSPLNYEEQVDRLKSFHKLIIENDEDAINILKRVNYYRLTAYGIGLTKADNKDEYIEGVTMNNLYWLYLFDSELRNQLLHVIEHIEIHLRAQIAYQLAIKYGAEGYMDSQNFSDKTDKDGNSIHQSIIDSFQEEVRRQRNLPFVKHHQRKYDGHFPIWVAVELFSFGKLSSLYSIMQNKDRKKISEQYSVSPDHLEGWIQALLEIRNLCAHYNRVYNLPLKIMPHLKDKYEQYANHGQGKPIKIFPVLIVIKSMTEPFNPLLWKSFFENLKNLINEYKPNSMLRFSYLGLPREWEQVLSDPLPTKENDSHTELLTV
ncbi:MAG: Abi family protein [Oscillospiraceae bacterium]|nr:Abi family protein [Oscillospiraceae bacterium]